MKIFGYECTPRFILYNVIVIIIISIFCIREYLWSMNAINLKHQLLLLNEDIDNYKFQLSIYNNMKYYCMNYKDDDESINKMIQSSSSSSSSLDNNFIYNNISSVDINNNKDDDYGNTSILDYRTSTYHNSNSSSSSIYNSSAGYIKTSSYPALLNNNYFNIYGLLQIFICYCMILYEFNFIHKPYLYPTTKNNNSHNNDENNKEIHKKLVRQLHDFTLKRAPLTTIIIHLSITLLSSLSYYHLINRLQFITFAFQCYISLIISYFIAFLSYNLMYLKVGR
jgi:hypothetical protein